MEITMKILKAQVLIRFGTDLVCLEVDKPSPFPPGVADDNLHMQFEVQANKGVTYCKEHLGIEPEIINGR